jgi:hypothetical protein
VLPDNYLHEMAAIMKHTADKASELVKFKTTNVAQCGNQGIQVMTKDKGENFVQSGKLESAGPLQPIAADFWGGLGSCCVSSPIPCALTHGLPWASLHCHREG